MEKNKENILLTDDIILLFKNQEAKILSHSIPSLLRNSHTIKESKEEIKSLLDLCIKGSDEKKIDEVVSEISINPGIFTINKLGLFKEKARAY